MCVRMRLVTLCVLKLITRTICIDVSLHHTYIQQRRIKILITF